MNGSLFFARQNEILECIAKYLSDNGMFVERYNYIPTLTVAFPSKYAISVDNEIKISVIDDIIVCKIHYLDDCSIKELGGSGPRTETHNIAIANPDSLNILSDLINETIASNHV